jgi:hypothetical protein
LDADKKSLIFICVPGLETWLTSPQSGSPSDLNVPQSGARNL